MVYGEWAATAGIVYPNWETALGKAPPLDEAWRFRLAGDFAAASITHMLLIALGTQTDSIGASKSGSMTGALTAS